MIEILYITIIMLNVMVARKKRANLPLIIITVVFLIVLMGLNTFNSDYLAYEDYYYSQVYGFSVEKGFALAYKIGNIIGLNYQGFLVIYFFVIILIDILAIKKLDGNYHSFFALYLLTAVFIDTCEIRQSIVYAIYLYALASLSCDETKKRKIRYIFTIIIASLFHRSAFIFIPFAFIYDKKYSKRFFKLYFCIILLFCIVIFINGNRIPGIELLSYFIPQDKMEYFYSKTRFGFILFFAANFLNIITIRYFVNRNAMLDGRKSLNNNQQKFIQIVKDSLIYLSCTMPLCMLNSEFLRYFRCSVLPVILVSSFFAKTMSQESNSGKTQFLIDKSYVVMVVYIIGYTITMQHFRVLAEVFSNNLIL